MKNFIGGMGVIALAFICSILNGYVFCILWEWFVASTFNVQLLTIPQAIGLSLVASAIGVRSGDNKLIMKGILTPFVLLALGWLVTLFL